MPPRYQEMFGRLDDTIVAICSPVGVSVRGIVRLSGPDAFPLAEGVFADRQGRPLAQAPGHRRILGRVWINASGTVPAEAYTFRAPASYTRQDVVELHLIGSPPVLAMVLEQLTNKGARPAEPGEFTARAYFSGAMDLTRVEGVAAIVYARSDAQLRASEALLHGRLSKRSTELRERLADLLALIEAEIDFAEEPIDFISRSQAIAVIDKATVELASLLRDSPSVERLEVLPEVMLVGPANAGKSTLFNRLTGMDRAIQSATAGTTRDVLRAPAPVAGGEVMLLDAAGLASAGEGPAALRDSHLAELAEKAARRAVACADLILLVLDGTNRPEQAAAALRPTLPARPTCTVVNKIDRLPPERLSALLDQIDPAGAVSAVSALTREGVELLRARIGRMLFDQAHSHGAEVLALANWQRTALRTACENLARARQICNESTEIGEYAAPPPAATEVTPGRPVPEKAGQQNKKHHPGCAARPAGRNQTGPVGPRRWADACRGNEKQHVCCAELLALEVREAMNALSLLIGEVATEDLLGRIFSRFCVGK